MALLRSKDRKVLIAMDCGDLGFGGIAAHGHADALSIQIYYEGKPVLVDSGTYNYHVPKKYRDEMRSTKAHNTVYVNGIEQAEMLGPFLWGNRYKISPMSIEQRNDNISVTCEISYKEVRHKRYVEFDGNRTILIADTVNKDKAYQCWNIKEQCMNLDGQLKSTLFVIKTNTPKFSVEDAIYSSEYGIMSPIKRYINSIENGEAVTEIILFEQ